MEGQLRDVDLLGRYGGEEFVVLLPSCALSDAPTVLERLREVTARGVTCSLGVVEWSPGETEESVIARADEALYAAKRGGRDRVLAAPV